MYAIRSYYVVEILRSLPELHWPTALIGLFSFAVIYGLRRFRPHAPAGLIALLLTSLAIWYFELVITSYSIHYTKLYESTWRVTRPMR